MWRHGYFRTSVLLAGLVAGAGTVLSLGGCPVAQQPTVPPADEPNQVGQTPPPPTNEIPRPVTSPPIPNTSTSSGGSGGSDPGTGPGGGGSDPSGGSAVVLKVNTPADNFFVRPGQQIQVNYELADPSGAVKIARLAVVRDENNDGQPDDGIVFSQSLAFKPGSNSAVLNTGAATFVALLKNGVGRFRAGIEITTVSNLVDLKLGLGLITVDANAPQGLWLAPLEDALVNRQPWPITLAAVDNASASVRVLLDPDPVPLNGNEFELLAKTPIDFTGKPVNFSPPLFAFPANTYHYYVQISDGIDPPTQFYATDASGKAIRLRITDRLVGNFALDALTNSSQGAIMQGFNFNDLAGSSMTSLPDMNADGRDELVVASRFGKPRQIQASGIGFGEAYLFYGNAQRLKGSLFLNTAGKSKPGLVFPGIRSPIFSPNWTMGMSDVTVIPDMDGDELPELVFSFPRVESVNLGETAPSIQHPELAPDLGGMGQLEYNAFYGLPPSWHINEAQFTRGGIVIVSSHNSMLKSPSLLNRKADRALDLHEVGQLFSNMSPPSLVPYIRAVVSGGSPKCADCDGEPPSGWQPGTPAMPPNPAQPGDCGEDDCHVLTGGDGTPVDGKEAFVERWRVRWDVVFNNQGPGGFLNAWTTVSVVPPLANPRPFAFSSAFDGVNQLPFVGNPFYPNYWVSPAPHALPACSLSGSSLDACEVTNEWFRYALLPCTTLLMNPSWANGGVAFQSLPTCFPTNPAPVLVQPSPPCPAPSTAGCPDPALDNNPNDSCVWTGFYGPETYPRVFFGTSESFEAPVGARILGQKVDDQFGTAVSSDGTWLYISAPERTANDAPYTSDIPQLSGTRTDSGIVYQLRTDSKGVSGVTRTQLWIEPGVRSFLDPNLQNPDPNDPNNYINTPIAWPFIDNEDTGRTDYTMPVPHQYVIEAIGSLRGNAPFPNDYAIETDCPPSFEVTGVGAQAEACFNYTPYASGTSGDFVDRTPQIVGPHDGAKISFVRALGDVNGDGIRDYAVGSEFVNEPVVSGGSVQWSGPVVGGIFIVYGRPTYIEGDYLLDQLALDVGDPNRLNGVFVHGSSATGSKLARVFADAGDVNKDGYADVIIGNETANGNAGETIILLGSPNLVSPIGGWSPEQIPLGTAIRFAGTPGAKAGQNVASAGDVDGDGFSDVLIAAPEADNKKGAVYLVYGASTLASLAQPISLANVGKVDLPGVRFAGRKDGDQVGGGFKTVPVSLSPGGLQPTVPSQGVATLGDIDGDGVDDFAISAMLADPSGKTDAGEVYILYGKKGP